MLLGAKRENQKVQEDPWKYFQYSKKEGGWRQQIGKFVVFKINYEKQRRIILLTVKSPISIYDFKFKSDDILMVGSESSGVSADVRNSLSLNVKIPILTPARCLNVTTAASIAISEAMRQNIKNINKDES